MTPAELTGKSRSHVIELPGGGGTLHVQAVTAFMAMRSAAACAGFDLAAASSFRDFDRQLAIWNGKFLGTKPLYGANGKSLAAKDLSPAERVAAILLWSALPGASRHHWGTDLDLIDRSAIAAGYRVQLTAEEFASGGPFAALSSWLCRHAARFGFFRPFRGVLSGVRSEPWHYSFAPLAEPARRALTANVLGDALAGAPIEGKAEILAQLTQLHARYVAAIDWP